MSDMTRINERLASLVNDIRLSVLLKWAILLTPEYTQTITDYRTIYPKITGSCSFCTVFVLTDNSVGKCSFCPLFKKEKASCLNSSSLYGKWNKAKDGPFTITKESRDYASQLLHVLNSITSDDIRNSFLELHNHVINLYAGTQPEIQHSEEVILRYMAVSSVFYNAIQTIKSRLRYINKAFNPEEAEAIIGAALSYKGQENV